MEEDIEVDILGDFDLNNFLNNLNEIYSPLEENRFCISADDVSHLIPFAQSKYSVKFGIQRKQSKCLGKSESETQRNLKFKSEDKVFGTPCPHPALQTSEPASSLLLNKKRKNNTQFYTRKKSCRTNNVKFSNVKDRVLSLNRSQSKPEKNEKILEQSRSEEHLKQEIKECEEDWAISVVDEDQQQNDISPAIGYGEGGLTLTHNDDGFITKVVVSKHSELVPIMNSSTSLKKKNKDLTRKLIYCKRFLTEKSVPFQITFYLEALLVAEVHCYSSHTTASKGLFLGWYDKDKRAVLVASCVPVADTGLTTYDWNLGSQQFVVGWYFSYPISAAEQSIINQPKHAHLRSLFTRKVTDPFFMLILSPYSRAKNRCIITVKGYPYFMDYKTIFTEEMCVHDTIRRMKEAISKGNNKNQFNEKCEHLNNKTCGQLCYESIRRLLDCTQNSVPFNVKEELIRSTKYLVGFSGSSD
ncbi:uncharacterized protein isoform X2 [Rhodnius prolixus]|uniref:uncharacterized protein isoform X2 n=1 Tax=Rhodnius prolixus TaxID=13249 RepID=UPI003D18BCE8